MPTCEFTQVSIGDVVMRALLAAATCCLQTLVVNPSIHDVAVDAKLFDDASCCQVVVDGFDGKLEVVAFQEDGIACASGAIVLCCQIVVDLHKLS